MSLINAVTGQLSGDHGRAPDPEPDSMALLLVPVLAAEAGRAIGIA